MYIDCEIDENSIEISIREIRDNFSRGFQFIYWTINDVEVISNSRCINLLTICFRSTKHWRRFQCWCYLPRTKKLSQGSLSIYRNWNVFLTVILGQVGRRTLRRLHQSKVNCNMLHKLILFRQRIDVEFLKEKPRHVEFLRFYKRHKEYELQGATDCTEKDFNRTFVRFHLKFLITNYC